MSTRSNNIISYDDEDIPKGKCVDETKMLVPGAREPEAFVKGHNPQRRDVKEKHKPWGKLGLKGLP